MATFSTWQGMIFVGAQCRGRRKLGGLQGFATESTSEQQLPPFGVRKSSPGWMSSCPVWCQWELWKEKLHSLSRYQRAASRNFGTSIFHVQSRYSPDEIVHLPWHILRSLLVHYPEYGHHGNLPLCLHPMIIGFRPTSMFAHEDTSSDSGRVGCVPASE